MSDYLRVDYVEGDATNAIQAAIRSGAPQILIPNVGRDWLVRPLRLASNQEIVLEPGVVIAAKPAEYQGRGACLLNGIGVENVVIRGPRAALRMRKFDYLGPGYQAAEWRHGVSLRGCRNVDIVGLRCESTGGDGIYVGSGLKDGKPCENVTLKDVICDDSHRQGLSIISARNLVADNCGFNNTWGTAPQAGIDIEPNGPRDVLENIVVQNSQAVGNTGAGLFVNLTRLDQTSSPVSIRFANCLVRQSGLTAGSLRLKSIDRDGPKGLVEFEDCRFEDWRPFADWKRPAPRLRLKNCTWKMRDQLGPEIHISYWEDDQLSLMWTTSGTRIETGSAG